jgi:hypothetical protein
MAQLPTEIGELIVEALVAPVAHRWHERVEESRKFIEGTRGAARVTHFRQECEMIALGCLSLRTTSQYWMRGVAQSVGNHERGSCSFSSTRDVLLGPMQYLPRWIAGEIIVPQYIAS